MYNKKRGINTIKFDEERVECFLCRLCHNVIEGNLELEEANGLVLELVNSDNEEAKNKAQDVIFNWVDNMNLKYR
ncbi:hypothetical protein [Abyssisolibacter fermentans]|uniref:hypothetical protein n=1 Tax=Abyssisolibacter fermentans TaxID=1766203 RepID=UPI00082A2B04|nr:hypothetical protein [Abyssisolibacter fermentans]